MQGRRAGADNGENRTEPYMNFVVGPQVVALQIQWLVGVGTVATKGILGPSPPRFMVNPFPPRYLSSSGLSCDTFNPGFMLCSVREVSVCKTRSFRMPHDY